MSLISALYKMQGKALSDLALEFADPKYKVAPEALVSQKDGDKKYLDIIDDGDFVLNMGAIIGDNFLCNVYIVFGGSPGDHPRICFAPTTSSP